MSLEIFQSDADARVCSRFAKRLHLAVKRVIQAALVARIADQHAIEVVGFGIIFQIRQ